MTTLKKVFFSKTGKTILVFFMFTVLLDSASRVIIGSKKFTESVTLGEIIGTLAKSRGIQIVHRKELGGTRILWNTLINGNIDAYPEYTGTIRQEILAGEEIQDSETLVQALKRRGILMTRSLGFNNTYIIGMKKKRAAELNINKISDLKNHPQLKLGFSNEFMDRGDGWPSLKLGYGLPQKDVRGMDHDIAYRGLENGTIDAMDLYSTDAEIQYYNLQRLKDDLNHFTEYKAVILYRADLSNRSPDFVTCLKLLEGKISVQQMTRMNARVKLDKIQENQVAAKFINNTFFVSLTSEKLTWINRFLKHTREHLLLVILSLTAAILVSIPLGIVAARYQKAGQIILGLVGIIQTIPSLALLVFMIPLLGIGGPPAVMALFLYSLLPIVRNTCAGIRGIPNSIIESAQALGLPDRDILFRIELPLASRTILAGIKTSAVINVGTATLGALIGAGGYGQPILTGIRLDDIGLILQGAIPAAVLALLVQFIFGILDRIIIPKGLGIKPADS